MKFRFLVEQNNQVNEFLFKKRKSKPSDEQEQKVDNTEILKNAILNWLGSYIGITINKEQPSPVQNILFSIIWRYFLTYDDDVKSLDINALENSKFMQFIKLFAEGPIEENDKNTGDNIEQLYTLWDKANLDKSQWKYIIKGNLFTQDKIVFKYLLTLVTIILDESKCKKQFGRQVDINALYTNYRKDFKAISEIKKLVDEWTNPKEKSIKSLLKTTKFAQILDTMESSSECDRIAKKYLDKDTYDMYMSDKRNVFSTWIAILLTKKSKVPVKLPNGGESTPEELTYNDNQSVLELAELLTQFYGLNYKIK